MFVIFLMSRLKFFGKSVVFLFGSGLTPVRTVRGNVEIVWTPYMCLPSCTAPQEMDREPPFHWACFKWKMSTFFLLGHNLLVWVRTAIASGLSGIFSRGTSIFGFCVGSVWDCFGHGKRQHLNYLETAETAVEVSPWLYKVSWVRIVYCGQSDTWQAAESQIKFALKPEGLKSIKAKTCFWQSSGIL